MEAKFQNKYDDLLKLIHLEIHKMESNSHNEKTEERQQLSQLLHSIEMLENALRRVKEDLTDDLKTEKQRHESFVMDELSLMKNAITQNNQVALR